jgi:hypothetical protein
MRYAIHVYELGMGYGGPEEGGWWFTYGDLRRTLRRRWKTKGEAARACRRMGDLLERMQDRNRSLRPLSSMAYSGGRYCLEVHPVGKAPKHFPEFRPRYE